MKDKTVNRDQCGLSRRQLLGLATLTSAGLAAASIGVPEAKAFRKKEMSMSLSQISNTTWRETKVGLGPGGSAKESTVAQLPVATSPRRCLHAVEAGWAP